MSFPGPPSALPERPATEHDVGGTARVLRVLTRTVESGGLLRLSGEGIDGGLAGAPRLAGALFRGATPVLGMLVANTRAAIRLCLAIFRARPEIMIQAHGKGPFEGENTFHVVCVQRQEQALIAMIKLACQWLDREQLEVAKNVWSYVVTITNGAAVKLGGGDLEPIGGSGSPKPQCFPTLEAALAFAKSEVRRKLGEGSLGKRRANSRYEVDVSVSYGYSDAVSGA